MYVCVRGAGARIGEAYVFWGEVGLGERSRMHMCTPLCRDQGCRTMRKRNWQSCHIQQGGAQYRGTSWLNGELC